MNSEPKVTRVVEFTSKGWKATLDSGRIKVMLPSGRTAATENMTVEETPTVIALLTAAVGEAGKGQATKVQPDPLRDFMEGALRRSVQLLSGEGPQGIHRREIQSLLRRLEAQAEPLTPDPGDRQCDEPGSAAP